MSKYNREEQFHAAPRWPHDGRKVINPGEWFMAYWDLLSEKCEPHNQPSFLTEYEIPG